MKTAKRLLALLLTLALCLTPASLPIWAAEDPEVSDEEGTEQADSEDADQADGGDSQEADSNDDPPPQLTPAVGNTGIMPLATEVAFGDCGVNGGDNVKWSLDSSGVLTISGTGDMADYNLAGGPWTANYFLNITDVIIENGVTSIGDYALNSLTNLTSVTIPDSVTRIGREAFGNCKSLASVAIPGSVTSIGHGAFSSCHSLTSVVIPDSVTSIDVDTFRNCISLASVTIPDSVTSIGDRAFLGCDLATVTIPDSVTSIGDYAFGDCSNLASISFQGITPPPIGSNAFDNVPASGTVYYPKGASGYDTGWLNNYFPSGWTLDEETAPTVLTAGAVLRTSDTDATVKFTSSVAGKYYYTVVDSGDQPGVIDTSLTGAACGIGENTVPLSGLTAGEKDIYIVVKDTASRVSDRDFYITIPAYTPTASPTLQAGSSGSSGRSSDSSGTTAAPSTAKRTVTPQHLGGYSWRVDLPALGFVDAMVDGVPLVKGEDCMAKSGSTILTLTDSYVNSLRSGTHTLRMEFLSATATVDFTVTPTGTGGGDVGTPNAPALTASNNDNMNPSTGR